MMFLLGVIAAVVFLYVVNPILHRKGYKAIPMPKAGGPGEDRGQDDPPPPPGP